MVRYWIKDYKYNLESLDNVIKGRYDPNNAEVSRRTAFKHLYSFENEFAIIFSNVYVVENEDIEVLDMNIDVDIHKMFNINNKTFLMNDKKIAAFLSRVEIQKMMNPKTHIDLAPKKCEEFVNKLKKSLL